MAEGHEKLGALDPRPAGPIDSVFADRPGLFIHRWSVTGDEEGILYPRTWSAVFGWLPDNARPCVTYFDGETVVCRCGNVTIGPLPIHPLT